MTNSNFSSDEAPSHATSTAPPLHDGQGRLHRLQSRPVCRSRASRFPFLQLAIVSFVVLSTSWFGLPAIAQPPQPRPESGLAEQDANTTHGEQWTSEQIDFFETRIRPLLVEHCYECHSDKSGSSDGGLRLDSADAIAHGGDRGRVLIPGHPEKSRIIRAVEYNDTELQMPPAGKLGEAQIEALRHWIRSGAADPRTGKAINTKTASPLDRDPKSHWAFIPPTRPEIPRTNELDARDAIDALAIETARTVAGLSPNAEASKSVLVRRLYFDLTGLPPTSNQITEFLQNDRPDAYVRLVDQLLATPAFGERFGRHWLDVARYADTVGYALAGRERRIAGSHRYRDWVVRAFAEDIPYDEMLLHQIAADRTDPKNEQGHLDAMGFLTIGRKFLNRLDIIDDQIDVITRGLLGLTVTCARCHDHKFDPIPTSDYYALGGIIFSSETPKDPISPLMLVDKARPVDSPILIRGQIGNPGPIAPRQFLTALRKPDEPRFTDGSGRWELAQRIIAKDNPLTARVMVNRIWGHLIGKPLVDSPSDFGFRTEPPKVPGILDELASEFAEHWSIKRLVRRIVLSRTYRQSANATPQRIAKDPDNQLLMRANRKRRDFESLRDSMLASAGWLDRSLGGEPVEITLQTPNPRRTIYALIDRQNLPAIFRTFDFANPDAHSPKRYFTTVPQQALFLLNSQQVQELAMHTAEAVRRDTSNESPEQLATSAFLRILGRGPDEQELKQATAFLNLPLTESTAMIDPKSLWSYGTARWDDSGELVDFSPLRVFKNNRWQAEQTFPAKPPFGSVFLSTEEGHTPVDPTRVVVRRFTAPFAGHIELRGQMGHRSDKGDGVVTTIKIGNQRRFREQQKKNNRPFGPITGKIEQGQSVDLIAAAGQTHDFDTFYWRVRIQLTSPDGEILETDSVKHFSGPLNPMSSQPLDRLSLLTQALLMSNEFAFID